MYRNGQINRFIIEIIKFVSYRKQCNLYMSVNTRSQAQYQILIYSGEFKGQRSDRSNSWK